MARLIDECIAIRLGDARERRASVGIDPANAEAVRAGNVSEDGSSNVEPEPGEQ